MRILTGLLCLAASLNAAGKEPTLSEEDRAYWFFQPLSSPEVPQPGDAYWGRNAIDAFVLSGLEKAGLRPSPEASRSELIRRASLDLHGIPPRPEEVEAFVKDPDPHAYEKLVDRLLQSPLYGERYARHWLDIVRYADSDGYKSDVLRPNAWRYRDYVIDSFNQDKSYERFVKEQLAGDELYPLSDEAKTATGFLRLWPYEDNQPDMKRHWGAILDDITDVSGEVFLGVSMKCARCHDHKADPISQKDYYRFQAFFGAISPWEDVRLGTPEVVRSYQEKQAAWEEKTAAIRKEMDGIKQRPWNIERAVARMKFPTYLLEILDKEERSPYEEQLARFADHMMDYRAGNGYENRIKGEERERWEALKRELAQFDAYKPKELEPVSAVRDVGGMAPKTYVGAEEGGEAVEPGYLSILGLTGDAAIPGVEGNSDTTGRRAALARWLTDGENPLSTRVISNRIWQWHFGKGIVPTSNDFGKMGELPSHPELLDWLARTFVEKGWSMKEMHRLIMTSSTYRQSASVDGVMAMEEMDRENRLLWRMPVRRMDAEQMRDSMLAVSGELDLAMGGPGVSEEESARRSIYVLNKRNKLDTMMNAFDTPDLHNSCPTRDATTTPIQALTLLNGEWSLARAERFADRLLEAEGLEVEDRIALAYRIALGRVPEERDIEEAQAFVEIARSKGLARREVWVDLCHVLMNTNEFAYVN